jgi:hypothetical protein
MIRILLEYVVPVLAPFAVYFGWMWFANRRAAAGQAKAGAANETGAGVETRMAAPGEVPWFWLSAASLVLLTATLVAVALTTGEKPNGVYHPPVYKDGKVIPGHIERPSAK